MRIKLQQFLRDESGATAIEYGLIAAGIGIALITLAGQAGDDIKITFEHCRDVLRSFGLGHLS